jgi:hypothetical protein
MYIVLLDCEGLGSPDQSENHDARVFCLSVLISTLLIFNSHETIDEKAINNLGLAAKLANNVLRSTKVQNSTSPVFIWLVRDFYLNLKKKDGSTMTKNEYLESKISNAKVKDQINRQII